MHARRVLALVLSGTLAAAGAATTCAQETSPPPAAAHDADVAQARQLVKDANRLANAGRFEEARPLYAQALDLRRRALGNEHLETADSCNLLGVALDNLGDYEAALALLEEALDIRRRLLGEESDVVADSYNNVASVLQDQGRYEDALVLYQKALGINRRVHGEEHWATANSYNNLGYDLKAMGKYAEARALYEKALEILRRTSGEEDPDTANGYNNVASVLNAQGHFAEALPYTQKALDIRRRKLGEAHPDTASSYNNVATILDDLGRHAEAESLYRKALGIARQVLGTEHPTTATFINNLASNMEDQGRYAEAQPLFEEALDIRRRAFGENHPATATGYNNVAYCLDMQGKFAQAQPLYEKALETRRRVFGENHAETAASYNNVAFNLSEQGHPAEAQRMFQRALDIRRQVLGEEHPSTGVSYNNVANALSDQQRHAEAEPLYRKSLEIQCHALGEDHPDCAMTYNNLAVNLSSLGREADALPLYEKAIEIQRRTLGENHPDTIASESNLAASLDALGRHSEAQALFEKALDARRAALGEHHPDTALAYSNLAFNQFRQGAFARALSFSQQALAIRQSLLAENHPLVISSLGDVATDQLALHRAANAIEPARAAVAASRSRRVADSGAGDEQARLREARAASSYYRLLGDALWEGTTPTGRPAATDEAYRSLQDSVASSAGAAVAQMGARFSNGHEELRRLARERQDLTAEWSANDAAILQALASREPAARERADRLRAEAARIAARLDAIDADLRTRFPSYFELVRPDAMTVAATKALLKPDEALLLIVPGEHGTHVVAITSTEVTWSRSDWTVREVRTAVSQLRCDLDASRCTPPSAADTRGMQRTDAPKRRRSTGGFDRQLAYALYEQVVAPAMPILSRARDVYVVTAGPLSSLPLSVLVTEPPADGDDADPAILRDTPWLLRKFALTTLPSVASLRALRAFESRESSTGGVAKLDFVGFGDPTLGAGSGATSGRGPTRASDVFSTVASNGTGLADPQALRTAFGPLPGTRIELEAMRQAFAPRARVILADQATETAVKTTVLEGVRVVAFSTHGLLAGEIDGIAEPGLVLTPPARATSDDDGLLTASEVAQLKLSADWVLLSACNTASSDGTPGADALSGLARAFFYAGARSLLVSHWPVRDDVASILTVDAIRRQQAQPELGRAEAVRQAELAILDASAAGHPAFAHPSAWAPFSLVGEGR